MKHTKDYLYDLLPVVYRMRDGEQGERLRAFLQVVAEQAQVVEDDITQLYENWFIETCQEWVVPYIGDLIGYLPVHEAGEPGQNTTARGQERNKILIPRREVAKTIRYRQRKGTLALLEVLANDITEWPARAVEFFKLLGCTQAINHLRLRRGQTIDLRDGARLDLLDGPFDPFAHTVDIRRINSTQRIGCYNLPSVGVFVWRLKSYSITRAPACHVDEEPGCYTFSALGNDVPLYTRPAPESDPTHIAEEINLPVPIRRRAFEERRVVDNHEQVFASPKYYGWQENIVSGRPEEAKSVAVWAPGWPHEDSPELIPAQRVVPADLTGWVYRPPRGKVAVDPQLGRIAFPEVHQPSQGVMGILPLRF